MASCYYNAVCCSSDCSCHTNMTSIWTLSPEEPLYMNISVLDSKLNGVLTGSGRASFMSNTYQNFDVLLDYQCPVVCGNSKDADVTQKTVTCDSTSCSCCTFTPESPSRVAMETDKPPVLRAISNTVSAFLLSPVVTSSNSFSVRRLHNYTFSQNEHQSPASTSKHVTQLSFESSSVRPQYAVGNLTLISRSQQPGEANSASRGRCSTKSSSGQSKKNSVARKLKKFMMRLKVKLSCN